METLLRDLRYSFRILAKNPGFAIVVVMIMALGIAASTTIFSVVNAVILRELPYQDPERLAFISENKPVSAIPWTPKAGRLQGDSYLLGVSGADLADWKNQSKSFSQLSGLKYAEFVITGGEYPQRTQGFRVEPNLFELLGVRPLLGRTFLAEEAQPGKDQVALVSYDLWQRRYAGDPELVGKQIRLDQRTHTIVGILKPDFRTPIGLWRDLKGKDGELYVPLVFSTEEQRQRKWGMVDVVARLKPGASLKQARSEMDTIAQRLAREYPDTNREKGVTVLPLHSEFVGNVRISLLALFGAVGLVLLIACANVSNLLLVRSVVQRKEIAIRLALGASRLRIVVQLMIQSLALSVVGGFLGVVFASWAVKVLMTLVPRDIPRIDEANMDWRVLSFALGVSLLSGLLFGLAPALRLSDPNLTESLKETSRTSKRFSRSRREILVIGEVALSLTLLTVAGLLVKSFWLVHSVDPGYKTENLLALNIEPTQPKYETPVQRVAFFSEIVERAEALPGVISAAVTTDLPLRGSRGIGLTIENKTSRQPTGDFRVNAEFRVVSPGYFKTMGISLLRGRLFTFQDANTALPVAIINQTMARRYWPGKDAIGEKVMQGDPGSDLPWLTIVGIVGDTRHEGLTQEPLAEVYSPYLQPSSTLSFFLPRELVVRTTASPTTLVPSLRTEVWAVNKDQPISNVQTLKQVLSDSLSQRRSSMVMFLAFSFAGLILTALGIYGVLSCTVTQRTHEIGIRMALGASPNDVFRLVVLEGMAKVIIGLIFGLALSLSLSKALSSLLYGVTPTDPITLVCVVVLLITVASLACYIPAGRATKVDPMVVLRYE